MRKKVLIMLVLFIFLSITLQASVTINIDTEKTQEPISKYIYGQFIEHLGRCIYGGIWAEMLEDRKFYYPVTDDYKPYGTGTDPYWKAGEFKYLNASPWKVIGPAGTVKMDTINAYVGKQTPVIQLPGDGASAGISQEGLALVAGKKYIGRIILAGDKIAAPITIRLVLDNGKVLTNEIKSISADFQTYPFAFKAPASSENTRIEIVSNGKGQFKIGTLSLMPDDNIQGWRKDVIALLKELNSPVYRWPGGNFVSGYNWRDGIGERDKRPPRKNPAWKGIEHNDVGIHEYMELMKIIDTEPFVAVNTGLGTVEEVAEEVEYCNGSIETPMGKLRAQNGHPEPYQVKWWAVGNEMYGNWQLGHIPLEEYVKKHNRSAEAVWKVDPKIQLIGVGSVGQWSETMLRFCSDYMNLISEHIYCQEKPDVTEHIRQLSHDIIHKADAHRKYRQEIKELGGKDIRIAMDEWNYWYGDYIYGELGVRYHHKDALGVAIGLHEYFRNSDIYFMANYAQTVNVIGCIKTTPTAAGFATTGLPLKLYRQHFGTIPLKIEQANPNLDIAAALTPDKKAITIAVVNPTDQNEPLALDFGKIRINEKCKKWTVHHADPEIYNEPGKTPNVTIQEENATFMTNSLDIPAYSIVMYRFEIQ
ncbi:alpha-N-arabinofuranosidase [candidate division KSB1 bacterium]|nr:alpha-N-arabinofuranosidase [candidate division KSB1 bacterium]